MRTVQRAQLRNAQAHRINPRLVAAGAILKMSSEELQLRLEEEVVVNPALEVVWDYVCPSCGRGLSNGACWYCRMASAEGTGRVAHDDVPLPSLRPRADGDEVYDPLENLQTPLSLREYVLMQARLVLSPGELAIAEYLVAGLSEDGLLEEGPEEVARTLGADQERVLGVLSQLQSLDPPGVCARSVQECVLLQVRELASEVPVPALVEPILSAHWRDLANHAYEKIARSLRTSAEGVEDAVAFIRDNLNPYPGRLYRAPYADSRHGRPGEVRPDVIVRRSLADYLVEVARPFDFELRVSEAYRRLALSARSNNGSSPEHVLALEHYRRATLLLQSLTLREQTVREIAEYLVIYQRPFLDTEAEHKMRPLTRTQVAHHIGKHASTVSRATSGKFMLLPSGNLVPFGKFFAAAVGPKTVMATLLSDEDPDRPLTDEQIRRILRVRGFPVARRTVAKYRLALRLPSSVQRGRH